MPATKATLFLLFTVIACTCVLAQKPITVKDMQGWHRIGNEQLSPRGDHLLYTLTKDVGDPTAVVYDTRKGTERRFPRLHDARLTYDGKYVIGLLKPAHDTVRHVRLTKKKKAKDALKEMDSLLVWGVTAASPSIIPNVYSYKLGERTAKSYAYTTASTLPDSLAKELDDKARRLVIRNFADRDSFYLEGVMNYIAARDAPVFLAQRTDKDSTWQAGIQRLDARELSWSALMEDSLDYAGLALSRDGTQAAFLTADADEDDAQKPYLLNTWRVDGAVATLPESDWKPAGYAISKDRTPAFSDDGQNLFFGTRPRRPERDTTLLDDEIADVEVWTTDDPRLYTQENARLDDERKRTYLAVYRTGDGRAYQIGDEDYPYHDYPDDGNGNHAIVYDDRPYAKETMWEGYSGARDFALVDLRTGEKGRTFRNVIAPARWLEGGKHLLWYNRRDTAWYGLSAEEQEINLLTDNDLGIFYDELNDRPMDPGGYGYAGTVKGGELAIVYDRYDLWQVDPGGRQPTRRLTRGREIGQRHFLRVLDEEDRTIDPDEPQLTIRFNQDSYDEEVGWLDLKTGAFERRIGGAKHYGGFIKARETDAYAYAESDFRQFPDLRFTTDLGGATERASTANPQQAGFAWGTAENYSWIDNQGRTLKGLLIKPDGFDPNKQYPLLVNFYERNSEGVNRHRTPVPGRSSINYSHYVSKGYVIFNPDIIYRVGYPGESAYDCVMSGVTSLLGEGFVDRERIGLQGHSWGGYQAAYLVTKTDLFAAVEAGAPVVNMFSAYGGIRWGSGLSRQFQYEHTQSRIGGSPWEYPLRYLENSPLFTTDKINTPLLILHNDADGAVPWYQGIEWFTALRRLGKEAWFLNYRGEPHWPVKTANRADFQTRMEQFFDYYLMDAPKPVWMERGVSPMLRGIDQGLEVSRK